MDGIYGQCIRPCMLTVSYPSGRSMHSRPASFRWGDGTAWRGPTKTQARAKICRLTDSLTLALQKPVQNFSTFLTIIFICWESHTAGKQAGRQTGRQASRPTGQPAGCRTMPHYVTSRCATPALPEAGHPKNYQRLNSADCILVTKI